MADFLNEHLIFTGLMLITLAGAELWLMLFRYDWLRTQIRKKPYLEWFYPAQHSRSVIIAVALLFFVYGSLIIGAEFELISRQLSLAVTGMVVLNFFGQLIYYYWRNWKKKK